LLEFVGEIRRKWGLFFGAGWVAALAGRNRLCLGGGHSTPSSSFCIEFTLQIFDTALKPAKNPPPR